MYGKRKYGKRHATRKRRRKSSGKKLSGRRTHSGSTPTRGGARSTSSGWTVKTTPFSFGKYKIPGFSYSSKSQTKEIEASGQHNDMDKEIGFVRLNPYKRFFKEFGTFKLTFSRSWTFNSTADGLQAVGDGYSIMSADQLANTAIASGTALTLFQNRNNYFDYNPSQNLSGGAAPGLGAPPYPDPDKIFLKNVNYEMSVYNATSVSTEVEVIFVMCKRDTVNSPVGAWTSAMTRERIGQSASTQPTTAFATGASNINQWTEGYGTIGNYGAVPMQYGEFNNFYKVLKTYKFILPSGDTHRIKTHFAINKVLNKAVALTAKANGNGFLKGYTISPIIISRGAVVKHADSAAVADQSFTYGFSKIGVVATVTHTLASVGQARISYQRFGAGIVSNTNYSTVDSIINDVDQVVNPVTN